MCAVARPEANYTTFANHDDSLDFSGVSGLTAYTATVSGETVTFTAATEVPAGTGLLLKGATADVPVIATAETVSNVLYAPTTAVSSLSYDDGTYYYYILTQPTGKNVGFYRANKSGERVTLPKRGGVHREYSLKATSKNRLRLHSTIHIILIESEMQIQQFDNS